MTATQRTPQEIEDLKADWKRDPIWDIEEAEGFEAHREELLAYRLECEEGWKRQYRERLERRAAELGMTPEKAKRYDVLTMSADVLVESAANTLAHYLRRCGINPEFGDLVGAMTAVRDSAVSLMRAELLKEGR